MPKKCCVSNCKVQADDPEGFNLSFHTLPTKEESRKSWLTKITEHANISLKYLHVCSKHFKKDCFVTTGKRRQLISGSLPTIFTNYNSEHCNSVSYTEDQGTNVHKTCKKKNDIKLEEKEAWSNNTPDDTSDERLNNTKKITSYNKKIKSLASLDVDTLSFSSKNIPLIKKIILKGQKEILSLRRKLKSERMRMYRRKKKQTCRPSCRIY